METHQEARDADESALAPQLWKKKTQGRVLWVLRWLEEDNISRQRDYESVLGLQMHVFNKSTTVSMYLPALTVLLS